MLDEQEQTLLAFVCQSSTPELLMIYDVLHIYVSVHHIKCLFRTLGLLNSFGISLQSLYERFEASKFGGTVTVYLLVFPR